MNNLEIQPITNEAALFIKKNKTLVIADLHIGIESELFEKGLQVSSQTKNMLEKIHDLISKYNAKSIVLLGDIKHNIPSSTYQERSDVRKFLFDIQSISKVHIIPGNHDGNISRFTNSNIEIHPSSGVILDGIGFTHGHCWPSEDIMKCSHLISAHTHPTIMLTDRLGYKTYEPCWVKSTFLEKLQEKYPNSSCKDIIIMPAFNPICGGIAVNNDKIIGPVAKMTDIDSAEIYLLDGSYLGKTKDIK